MALEDCKAADGAHNHNKGVADLPLFLWRSVDVPFSYAGGQPCPREQVHVDE